MKLNRNRLRKMILAEMFGARPRGPQEEEMTAQAIQQCVQDTLNSGPTPELPDRQVMRERLDAFRAGMGEEERRVTFALNIRTQEPAAQCAADFGIPHLESYIRIKAFNMIAQMYSLSKRY